MTTLRILGSAAGGGFPQWNCNCRNCAGVRGGTLRAVPRTQSSLALSEHGVDWLLVNASPDILTQLRQAPELQPGRHARDTGIAAVLLMDAQIDHVAGLPMLREHQRPLPLYATAPVLEDLATSFPLTCVMAHYCGVETHPVPLDGRGFTIAALQNVELTAIPLDSKAPPYSPGRNAARNGDNIGLRIVDRRSGQRAFYAPGLGSIAPHVLTELQQADVVLVDGTFWSSDEMQRLGLSPKSAAEMGHLALSGTDGMIATLDALPATRKILIHINNTNPILDEDAPERRELSAHGIEVAHDGMELVL